MTTTRAKKLAEEYASDIPVRDRTPLYETTRAIERQAYRKGYEAGLEEGKGALDALKAAYKKHVLMHDDIGWSELGDMLCDSICNLIGDDGFVKWLEEQDTE